MIKKFKSGLEEEEQIYQKITELNKVQGLNGHNHLQRNNKGKGVSGVDH
jgi:hypothetical protein